VYTSLSVAEQVKTYIYICNEHPTTAMRMGFINSNTTAREKKTVDSFMLLSYLLHQRFPTIPCTALH
jgi:hypothetical protein